MTPSERSIAERLIASVEPQHDMKDKSFISQLRNWYDRDMSEAGRNRMVRLLHRYCAGQPDYYKLYNQYLDERLNQII